jgi:hypothetical protein
MSEEPICCCISASAVSYDISPFCGRHVSDNTNLIFSDRNFTCSACCNSGCISCTRSSSVSSGSPGNRIPRVRPGATLLSPFEPSSSSFTVIESFRASSRPPGQKGTYPDLPLTKLLLGAGVRSRDVDVNPLVVLGFETFTTAQQKYLR